MLATRTLMSTTRSPVRLILFDAFGTITDPGSTATGVDLATEQLTRK